MYFVLITSQLIDAEHVSVTANRLVLSFLLHSLQKYSFTYSFDATFPPYISKERLYLMEQIAIVVNSLKITRSEGLKFEFYWPSKFSQGKVRLHFSAYEPALIAFTRIILSYSALRMIGSNRSLDIKCLPIAGGSTLTLLRYQ